MPERALCPHCGHPLAAGGGACPGCGRAPASRAAPAPAAHAPVSSARTARAQVRGEFLALFGVLMMFAPLAIGVGLIALGVVNLLVLLPAALVAFGIGVLLWRAG